MLQQRLRQRGRRLRRGGARAAARVVPAFEGEGAEAEVCADKGEVALVLAACRCAHSGAIGGKPVEAGSAASVEHDHLAHLNVQAQVARLVMRCPPTNYTATLLT